MGKKFFFLGDFLLNTEVILGGTLKKPHGDSVNNIILILIEKPKTLKQPGYVQTQKNMPEGENLLCA